MRRSRLRTYAAVVAAAWVLAQPAALMADTTDDEIRELKQRLERLEQEREQQRARIDGELKDLRKTTAEMKKEPALDLVITGYGHTLFRDRQSEPSSFLFGSLNPIVLARYRDNILFEAEFEFEVEREEGEGTQTNTEIEYAQIDYLVNDWLTLIAGRFYTPLGVFNEKLHPAWINKLPNGPLPYGGHDASLLPLNDIGLQARGAVPIGDARLTYAVFVSNGPGQEAAHADESGEPSDARDSEEEEEEEEGEHLDFAGSAADNNSSKNFGGRIGFLPVPGVEFGVSGTTGRYDDDGDLAFSALVIDAAAQHFGFAELRGEWIRTWQERRTVADIDRTAFWVQAAMKIGGIPSDGLQDALDAVSFLRRLELVGRYSEIDTDEADADREQWSAGVNCYLTNTLLLKTSYDFNDGASAPDRADAFNAQIALGW